MDFLNTLKIKLYADSADINTLLDLAKKPYIAGFTTNPSLLYRAGIKDYRSFVTQICQLIQKPLSFEVLADDLETIFIQAQTLASLGSQIYVKIPIRTSKGEWTLPVIQKLAARSIRMNITALFDKQAVEATLKVLNPKVDAILSIFAGRIADTGRNPFTVLQYACKNTHSPQHQILWASSRELYNIFQAQEVGCHIITLGFDLIKKLSFLGKDLDELCLETITTFYHDAVSAGLSL